MISSNTLKLRIHIKFRLNEVYTLNHPYIQTSQRGKSVSFRKYLSSFIKQNFDFPVYLRNSRFHVRYDSSHLNELSHTFQIYCRVFEDKLETPGFEKSHIKSTKQHSMLLDMEE